jgi:hypothetical protein
MRDNDLAHRLAVLTGFEVTDDGVIQLLDGDAWRKIQPPDE